MAESVESGGADSGGAQLRIQLRTDSFVHAADVVGTARDVELLLRELERSVATWEWAEPDPTLDFVAYANGATPETLQQVVTTAREGFRRAKAGEPWPDEFSKTAERHTRAILRRLKRLQEMVVEASGETPLVLRDVEIGERIVAQAKPRRIFSSVDGVLRMLGETDQNVVAGLNQHQTKVSVRCSFPA